MSFLLRGGRSAIFAAGLVLTLAALPAQAQPQGQTDARYEQLLHLLEAQQRRIDALEARLTARETVPAGSTAQSGMTQGGVTQGGMTQGGMTPGGMHRGGHQHGGPAAATAAARPAERPRELALTLRPLLMKPMSDSFRFLSGDANADTQTATVSHGFEGGIEGGLVYAPAGRGFAVALEGRHLAASDSARARLSNIALFDAGFGGPAGAAGNTVVARSDVKSWQADFDLRSRPRGEGPALFAGLRYAELNRDLDITNNVDAVSYNQANFRGAGPRVGADGRLALGGGFYLDGGVAASLLLGTGEVGSQVNTAGLTPNLFYRAENHRAVPVFDGRLALGWTLLEDAGGLSALGIELGVRAQHWMGLQDFVFSTDTLVGAANVGDTDMTFAGPYLAVTARW